MGWQEHYTPEEYRALIKKLVYVDGLSASKAAAAIGHGVTKNSVIRQMQTIMGRPRNKVKFPDSVWPSTPKFQDTRKPEATPEVPVHLTKASANQCRAPLWPDFIRSRERVDPSQHMYCGKKCREDSAFCEEHHAVFFMDPPKRKPKQKGVRDNSRMFE